MPPQQQQIVSIEKDYWKTSSKSFFYYGLLLLIVFGLVSFSFSKILLAWVPWYYLLLGGCWVIFFFVTAYLFKRRLRVAIYLGLGIVALMFILLLWSLVKAFNVLNLVGLYFIFSLAYPLYHLWNQERT